MTVEKSLSNALSRETILAIDKNGKGFQSIRFRMMKCSRYSMIATLLIVEFTFACETSKGCLSVFCIASTARFPSISTG